MESDETTAPEEEQETSQSEEEQIADNGSEAEETLSDESQVPYSRFKEVIDSRNEFKTDIDTLKGEIEALKQQQPKEEEEEPLDWKEARQKTIDKAVATMEAKQQEIEKVKTIQGRLMEKRFQQLKSMGQDITPAMEKSVLKRLIETSSDDVIGTFLELQATQAKTTKGEQVKKEGFVPPSHKGTVADKDAFTYKEIRGKSLDELMSEAN